MLPRCRVAVALRREADLTAMVEGVANRREDTAMAGAATAPAALAQVAVATDQAAMDRAALAQVATDLEATLGQTTWESARVEEKVRERKADGHLGVIPRQVMAMVLVTTMTSITLPQGVEVVDLLRRILRRIP